MAERTFNDPAHHLINRVSPRAWSGNETTQRGFTRILFVFRMQFSQCNSGVNILFTSVYNLSILYTYISLLYTCSNLLTVNMIALNTVPPGTGE